MKNKKNKLLIELVPKSCHFSNARTMVKKEEWDKIRFITYEKAGNVCEICGESGKNQGYKHNVECHEIWEYDDITKTQILIGLISLCPKCHQVKHYGRSVALGKEKEAIQRLLQVNKWKLKDVEKHISESYETYKERSKFEWKLDISILSEEPYNIKIKKTKKRVFKKKPFKKRRKKIKNTK